MIYSGTVLNYGLESTIKRRGLSKKFETAVRGIRSSFQILVQVVFIIMVGVWEDQGILTLKHQKKTL